MDRLGCEYFVFACMTAQLWLKMAGIQQQLGALLGSEEKQVRKTEEDGTARVSVIDVVSAITGQGGRGAAVQFGRLVAQYPGVDGNCILYKFAGARQRNTLVCDVRSVVEIILLLPGAQAARLRRQVAELVVRYLGGDLTIIDDVCRIRGFQEELAARAPEDPRRAFGEAVEASRDSVALADLARAFSTLTERRAVQEETLARVRRLLEQDRAQITLNVRAPKRARDPPIARDISGAGRPLPLAKFLDQKEREDASWKRARRSFAPTFGMLMQVLKKQKLREQGAAPIYVEQLARAQLLYTEEDRALFEQAWAMSEAHREELVTRTGPPAAAALPPPAATDGAPPRPSVLDMLRRAA